MTTSSYCGSAYQDDATSENKQDSEKGEYQQHRKYQACDIFEKSKNTCEGGASAALGAPGRHELPEGKTTRTVGVPRDANYDKNKSPEKSYRELENHKLEDQKETQDLGAPPARRYEEREL